MGWRGMAYFKSHSLHACQEGLVADREATTYLNLAPKVFTWCMGRQQLTRDEFIRICVELMDAKRIRYTPQEQAELYEVFESMDFDQNGVLSRGEWASGLAVFFRGTPESSVNAVFAVLDEDKNKSLSKSELQEYLKPFVHACTPSRADALRPLLLKRTTDDIYKEMD